MFSLLLMCFVSMAKCMLRMVVVFVFVDINERDVELNTRREIPYLQATTYYFVYHINTIALY